VLRGTAVGIGGGGGNILCDLELEGKYFGNQEWEGKYFGLRAGRKIFLKSRMRKKTRCDEKLEGKYFGNPNEKENILDSELEGNNFGNQEWKGNCREPVIIHVAQKSFRFDQIQGRFKS
jgi:hypothetical protein